MRKILKVLFNFFFYDGRKWQPSCVFTSVAFAAEMLISLYLLVIMSSLTRFDGIWDQKSPLLIWIFFNFFCRIALLHLIFGMLLRCLEHIFSVRRKLVFYAMITFYALIFPAIRYPQIFDESVYVSRVLASLRLFDFPLIPQIAGNLLIVWLWISCLSRGKFQKKFWVPTIASSLALFCFFNFMQPVEGGKVSPSQSRSPQSSAKHIILFSVDSLRGDTNLSENPLAGEALKNFVSESTGFKNVISPLAQTHGAFASIFSGKSPVENGVRFNLSKETLETDNFLANSSLEKYVKMGYRVELMLDTEEYSIFLPGKIISKVQSPHFPASNVFISTIFRNKFIYSFFNNTLGYALLPEIKDNTSFAFSNDLSNFTKRVRHRLEQLSEETQPTLLIVHSCAMHWPAILPYPYYPQTNFLKFSETPFSYTTKFRGYQQELADFQWGQQARVNKQTYNRGVDYMVERFLNPLFESAENLALQKSSVIGLMSDHGDFFWDDSNPLPYRRMVSHGSSLIFSADSEYSYLKLHFPRPTNTEAKQNNLSLTNLLEFIQTQDNNKFSAPPRHSDFSKDFQYSETGLWTSPVSDGQFITASESDLGPLFEIDFKTRSFFIPPAHTPRTIQQKHRSIYRDNLRYSLYPTYYGYREFLCDRGSDPECKINLQNHKQIDSFRKEMSKYIHVDVQNKLMKIGPCSRVQADVASEEMSQDEMRSFQWQYFYQAMECLTDWRDSRFAAKTFNFLLNSPELESSLRERIHLLLNFTCMANSFSKTFLDCDQLGFSQRTTIPWGTYTDIDLVKRKSREEFFRAYGLVDHLSIYNKARLKEVKAKGSREDTLLEILRQLNEDTLQPADFNYLLFQVDSLTSKSVLPSAGSLQSYFSQFPWDQSVYHFRNLEIAYAMYKTERAVCAPAARSSGLCRFIDQKSNSDHRKIWVSYFRAQKDWNLRLLQEYLSTQRKPAMGPRE